MNEKLAVTQMPITTPIILLVLYVVTHLLLFGYIKEEEKKEQTEEAKKNIKALKIVAKWYPAIYLVVVIILMYSL